MNPKYYGGSLVKARPIAMPSPISQNLQDARDAWWILDELSNKLTDEPLAVFSVIYNARNHVNAQIAAILREGAE